MKKDVMIGTLCGIAAVTIFSLLTPRGRLSPAPADRRTAEYYRPDDRLHIPLWPTTQPDPARQKLNRVLGDVRFKKMALSKVVAYLGEKGELNISVNWRSLNAAGISADTPVTVDFQNATAQDVLMAALKDAGGGNVKLDYAVIDGMVKISTADDLSQYLVTRIYNVRDIVDVRHIRAVRVLIAPTVRDGPDRPAPAADAIDEIVGSIEETVDPTSWRDAGGSVGGIRGFDGLLVVTQTEVNQEGVMRVLTTLRQK